MQILTSYELFFFEYVLLKVFGSEVPTEVIAQHNNNKFDKTRRTKTIYIFNQTPWHSEMCNTPIFKF